MRIIAGKHKGRSIETLHDKKSKFRPTTGRTKEALFNILTHGQFAPNGKSMIEDARVLDLFCGSGALAIEALSRGASFAVLIDMKKEHLDIARRNIAKLGEEANTAFIRADSSSPPPAHTPCNLVFIDPPYHLGLAQVAMASLVRCNWLDKDAVVVVETARGENITAPQNFTELENRDYGNSRIRIFRHCAS